MPFIWIKENAKEALDFYTGLFADSKIVQVTPIEGAPGPAGQFVATFLLKTAGPISLVVPCDTQREIDMLWDAFSQGGKPIACGWISDRFGVTWQVVPAKMGELMSGEPDKVRRVTEAMMKMMKFDIAALEAAARS